MIIIKNALDKEKQAANENTLRKKVDRDLIEEVHNL